MPEEEPSGISTVSPAKPSTDYVGLCLYWGRHVVSKLHLAPYAITANLTSSTLWRRVGAAVIDGIVIYCFFKLAGNLPFVNVTPLINGPDPIWSDSTFWLSTINPINPLLLMKVLLLAASTGHLDPAAMQTMLMAPFFGVCTIWLYHAIMESSPWQATLGKKICGLVVADTEGKRISFGRATLRTFAKSVSFLPYFIVHLITDFSPLPQFGDIFFLPGLCGYLVAVAAIRQQGLHDAIADTIVKGEKDPVTILTPKPVAPPSPRAPKAIPQTAPSPTSAPAPDDAVEADLPVRPAQPQQDLDAQSSMKECPACAEWIKAKAIKCRYCGERFGLSTEAPAPEESTK